MTNSFKAALWTAIFTFIATAGTALVGLLGSVTEWINGGDPIAADVSNFGKVVASAFVAGVAGLVNWAVRAAQAKGVLPGSGPSYDA